MWFIDAGVRGAARGRGGRGGRRPSRQSAPRLGRGRTRRAAREWRFASYRAALESFRYFLILSGKDVVRAPPSSHRAAECGAAGRRAAECRARFIFVVRARRHAVPAPPPRGAAPRGCCSPSPGACCRQPPQPSPDAVRLPTGNPQRAPIRGSCLARVHVTRLAN